MAHMSFDMLKLEEANDTIRLRYVNQAKWLHFDWKVKGSSVIGKSPRLENDICKRRQLSSSLLNL